MPQASRHAQPLSPVAPVSLSALVTPVESDSAEAPRRQEGALRPPRSLANWFNGVGIALIHVGTVYAFVRGGDLGLIGLAAAFYFVRMFAITGVYHRYFAHRSYKTSRPFQFVLALVGTSATQKGPLWWASAHRVHHKYSDLPEDVHSPKQRGFWHAHMGWWLGRDHEETKWKYIKDFAKYPELVFLEKGHLVGVFACMALATMIRGFDGFLWGYVVSTCVLHHGVFCINSLAHVYGSRRYGTTDTSRNNFWLSLVTLGEGWHNNHHHYMHSANQGFFWWEIDVTYYILKGFERLGLIWDLKKPPRHVLENRPQPKEPAIEPLTPIGDV